MITHMHRVSRVLWGLCRCRGGRMQRAHTTAPCCHPHWDAARSGHSTQLSSGWLWAAWLLMGVESQNLSAWLALPKQMAKTNCGAHTLIRGVPHWCEGHGDLQTPLGDVQDLWMPTGHWDCALAPGALSAAALHCHRSAPGTAPVCQIAHTISSAAKHIFARGQQDNILK